MPDNLPALPDDIDIDEAPVDGEIVDEPEAPAVVVVKPVVNVFQAVTIVVQHPVPRAAARHAGYVPAGVIVAWRRWRHAKQRPERMMQMAEVTGDHAQVIAWRQQLEQERQNRHGRLVKTAETVVSVARTSVWIIGGTVAVLAVLGCLLAFKWGMRGFLWPWETAAAIAVFAVSLIAALWFALIGGIVAVVLAVLYRTGRRGGDLAPGWAVTAADGDVDHEVTELLLTNALANLRYPQVRDYLKTGMPLQFITGCRQEGRGTFAAIRLPGIPAERVVRRRADFAAGVHRQVKEVWLKPGSEAAILESWIADKGALEEGAGPYPLLGEGLTDVFKGLPFGRSLKGDPVKIPVIGRNSICGGAPEQGKSNGARVVTCGYTLDIVTEVRLYIPDTNFDFERFKPRCSSYVMGAEDEWIEQILGELEELKEEIQRRGQLLIDAEAEEVTYKLAHAGIGLHPVFVLLEEAHVVIQHRKFGKAFTQLLPEIVKLDRKRGIHMMISTQAPTKDSMPRDVTRNCTVGIAYAVGDHVANDALLGQGAYRAGHRATELIPGTDRGTALVRGFASEARSEMVQAYRVSGRSGDDQVTPLVDRALAAMAEQGRPVPGTERGPLAIVSRDLLADLATVIRSPERILVRDAVGLLRELAPSWGPYRAMTATSLRGDLLAAGVRTVNASGTHYLDPADLREVISKREACE